MFNVNEKENANTVNLFYRFYELFHKKLLNFLIFLYTYLTVIA